MANGRLAQQPSTNTRMNREDCKSITDMETDDIIVIVERIVDGDFVATINNESPMRLWGIHAPEGDQPGGQRATDFLSNIIRPGDILMFQHVGEDIYERMLVIISMNNGTNLNHLLVEQVWAFPYYAPGAPQNPCLEAAQRFARTNSRGLWRMQENAGTRPWVRGGEQRRVEGNN